MLCNRTQDLFSDYISGDLDRAMTVTIENHLNSCEACREDVASMRRVWFSLNEMPPADTPAFFHENLMSRLDAAIVQSTAVAPRRRLGDWRTLLRPSSLALAASLLICVLAGAEVVETQRASLGPLEIISRLFKRPAPAPLQSVQAEWVGATNTLLLHLQPNEAAKNRFTALTYTINFNRLDGGAAKSPITGVIPAVGVQTISVPLDVEPMREKVAMSLQINAADESDHKTVTETVAIRLPSAVSK